VEDVTEGERQRAKQVLAALVWCPFFFLYPINIKLTAFVLLFTFVI
jgi:hypothetical protein